MQKMLYGEKPDFDAILEVIKELEQTTSITGGFTLPKKKIVK